MKYLGVIIDDKDLITKEYVDSAIAKAVHPSVGAYEGKDLSQIFADAAALHTAVAAGDFSKIHIGDYWPITLNGNFTDFSLYTVPSGKTYYSDAACTTSAGTTSAAYQGSYQSATAVKFTVSGAARYAKMSDCSVGYQKSVNTAVKMEVAAIDMYLNINETPITDHHLVMCSRDCLPVNLSMRCSPAVWYDNTQNNPWRGSALWATLNDRDRTGYTGRGVIKLLDATDLGPYVYTGPNGDGMEAYLIMLPPGQTSGTGQETVDRGRLFLPEEREIFYSAAGATAINELGNVYVRWPIFDGTFRHIVKRSGDGGSRISWWTMTPYQDQRFTRIMDIGVMARNPATYGTTSVPLCFLLV